MNLQQLQKQWLNPSAKNASLQAEIWDSKAYEFIQKPLPDFHTNPFLQYMEQKTVLNKEMNVLDIGCGSGSYSLALAERVKNIVGIDISPKMIEGAKKQAKQLSLANTKFIVQDWISADLNALQKENRFHIVFAHMTPAVCDYQTLDKMMNCEADHYFLVKPAKRKDSVLDHVFSIAGITDQQQTLDDGILNSFSLLWLKGYCPEVTCRNVVWENTRTLSDTAHWCINRAKLHKNITPETETDILSYLDTLSIEGYVKETVTTTIITLYWHK